MPPQTASRGRYLRRIYVMQTEDPPVAYGRIADSLGVSAPSVSAMIDKLVDDGLVERQGKRDLRLSARGVREALAAVRRQRLLETFLADILGMGWDEVREEADALEHVVSSRFVECMESVLDDPSRDPHGDPIPTRDGRYAPCTGAPLAGAVVGRSFRIERVSEHDGAALRHLAVLGMVPGIVVMVDRREAYEDSIQVTIRDRSFVLGLRLAANVYGTQVADTALAATK